MDSDHFVWSATLSEQQAEGTSDTLGCTPETTGEWGLEAWQRTQILVRQLASEARTRNNQREVANRRARISQRQRSESRESDRPSTHGIQNSPEPRAALVPSPGARDTLLLQAPSGWASIAPESRTLPGQTLHAPMLHTRRLAWALINRLVELGPWPPPLPRKV